MHISNDRYFIDRERHDLALRMIRHEARTCTIRTCTGLTDDRIRRLYKTYANHLLASSIRRRRGKSPRQSSYFIRNVRAQYESSLLAGTLCSFGLLRSREASELEDIRFGRLFCDAFETHRQLLMSTSVSFEHAWYLLQLLSQRSELRTARCRRCHGLYLRDAVHTARRSCPVCKLKGCVARRSVRKRTAARPSCARRLRRLMSIASIHDLHLAISQGGLAAAMNNERNSERNSDSPGASWLG